MTRTRDDRRGALDSVERILNRGGDADDVLRDVVHVLGERFSDHRWIAIAFVEDGDLVIGPSLGSRGDETLSLPVSYRGRQIAELSVDAPSLDADDRELLERVALLISPYCLVAEGRPPG